MVAILAAMSERDAERLRRLYDEWARGNMAGDLFGAESRFVPFIEGGSPLTGREAVREFMRGFLDQWNDFRIECEEMTEIGDSIIVTERQRATGKASGVESEMTAYAVWSFEDGELREVRWEPSYERALEVARGRG